MRFTTAEMPKWNRSRSAVTTSVKRVRPRRKSWRSPSPTGSPMSRRPAPPVSMSTSSCRGCRFFFNSHLDFFEEIGKFRAARRIWARWMRERYGAQDERSLKLRFHTQTAGVSLTAQQPELNIARVALQALAAVLGGTQIAAHRQRSTRRWRCRPRRRRASRCARSRSSPTRPASPTSPIRSVARRTWSG